MYSDQVLNIGQWVLKDDVCTTETTKLYTSRVQTDLSHSEPSQHKAYDKSKNFLEVSLLCTLIDCLFLQCLVTFTISVYRESRDPSQLSMFKI